jgi:hypothetical protein
MAPPIPANKEDRKLVMLNPTTKAVSRITDTFKRYPRKPSEKNHRKEPGFAY